MSNSNTPKATITSTDATATISVQPKNLEALAPTTEQLNQAKDVIVAAPWLQDVSALFGLTVEQVDDLIQQTVLNFGEITRLVYVGLSGDKESASHDIKALYGDMLPNITMDQLKANVMTNGMLLVPKIRDWLVNTFGAEAGEAFDEAFKQVFAKVASMKENKASLSDYAKEIGNFFMEHAPANVETIKPPVTQQRNPTLERATAGVVIKTTGRATTHNNFREVMEELAKQHPQKPPVEVDTKQGEYIPAGSVPALAW